MNPGERYANAAELELDLQRELAGAADSHARTLGRVVGHAFATSRAEREALIARALGAGKPPSTSPGYPRARAQPDGAYWTNVTPRRQPTVAWRAARGTVEETCTTLVNRASEIAVIPIARSRTAMS